jgi:two-component system, response regulator YesN
MYRVLVVDDEKLTREGIAEVFRAAGGMEVFTARNGEEALRTLREAAIDGMILDIKMPGVDGLQVLETAARDGTPMPVTVILSGYDDFSYAQRAIPHGIADYVVKPLSPQKAGDLAKSLVRLMERRRAGGGKPAGAPAAAAAAGPRSAAGPGSPLSALVIAYVEEHLAEEISNEILSAVFRYSPNYLGQLFKKEAGVSISEFVTRRRVEEAKRILREERLTVSEVAYRVGFNDNHYFCTVFKRQTGVTPREYRTSAPHQRAGGQAP